GFSAYLIKPIKRTELHRCLAKVIASDEAPAQPHPPAPPAPCAAAPVNSLRILVAEDDGVNQRVALWQLEKLGYKADAVADGQKVIQALDRADYDVVLMDCRMPELDGYQTTGRLRATGRTVYVIAMTANAM